MCAFTFMPRHEFERGGDSDGQKCNFGYMKGQTVKVFSTVNFVFSRMTQQKEHHALLSQPAGKFYFIAVRFSAYYATSTQTDPKQ